MQQEALFVRANNASCSNASPFVRTDLEKESHRQMTLQQLYDAHTNAVEAFLEAKAQLKMLRAEREQAVSRARPFAVGTVAEKIAMVRAAVALIEERKTQAEHDVALCRANADTAWRAYELAMLGEV